ncbi:type I polyketide synthase [Deminuibacter soli]|uniref:SDR family NAD(P)-dependent oxidoreductase n=1 Tax=Deminuibacter soli TaxID=2291815 RepID=A0A3E1NHG8_9BACT|nr:type I polyketide synthase [Deminuibacter soli]RFM27228.1 SDR family NAD(P)-dependent oxidoreductase [Deminuibacter soli]
MTSTTFIVGITPFEQPDADLAVALAKAGLFPVIHAGRDAVKANAAVARFTAQCSLPFGICFPETFSGTVDLPQQATMAIVPFHSRLPIPRHVQLYYQVYSLEEALAASAAGATALVLKGSESGGCSGDTAAFILLQQVLQQAPGIPVLLQGGIGVHNAAAITALGAAGVVLDSQLALFPESNIPKSTRTICEKLNGSETRLIGHYRVLVRPDSPALTDDAVITDYFTGYDVTQAYLPIGQDITLAIDLQQQYKKLSRLYFAMREAMHGHLKQAQHFNILSAGNKLAQQLQLTYPIAQGPMTRVSDVPAFAAAVANAGALPFVALSLLKGEQAKQLLRETKQQANGNTWGAGILGFADAELRNEQIGYILEEKPPVVLIAGGTPAQAKSMEQAGIPAFLHVPSASLLDLFLREGATKFVFEGRECGGHVGPLSSLVLWEKQINRLLQEDDLSRISIFFAGGIHDARSAALVATMAAPLAARGAAIGVLMGTAYLYTQEAVSTGAILPQFQQQAIAQQHTVLLETAPGHETRCLQSPFTDFFKQEKLRLQQEGVPKKEIWEQLESLNVGRLRIAAKGLERNGNNLQQLNEQQQLQNGMYMIGQVAALQNKVLTMQQLHQAVAMDNYALLQQAMLPEQPVHDDQALNIAIVGMACIYPGARNVEEFWRNIILGKDAVTEVPDERWNKALYYDPASVNGDKTPSKWGGFIPSIDFDPLAFGIPPQSLAAIEPTQLLSLLVAKQALDNAGYGSDALNKENVSVIIGAEGGNDLAGSYTFRSLFTQLFGEIPAELDAALPRMTEDSFPGVLANVISGRITNRLDLGGRNYTVDAACASSLAALDLACQELQLEKSDMVLAGAADLHNSICDYLLFSSTQALSRKGRCSTFDAGADGIALGEGIAMLVLKRHADAKRDGDTVYAVIKGIGGSSDGKSLGLTAPRKNGQLRALERAYTQAGISPAAAGLIEAHGTGTVVGDKTELSALSQMFQQSGALTAQTWLGSVKTQIGHTKCAAGLAGVIKAALSVYHGVKPATLHLSTPNAYYKAGESPFAFNQVAGVWNSTRRVAGISAFGFGGTNFHAVIENDTQAAAPAALSILQAWPSELFVFRGKQFSDAQTLLRSVHTLLQHNDGTSLTSIAFSLHQYSNDPIQLCIVANDAEDLAVKINLALSGAAATGVYPLQPVAGKVAFLFPGQGSQRINMARDLFVCFPALRSWLAQYPAYEQLLFPAAVFTAQQAEEQKQAIKDTRIAQPLLGITGMAIAQLLQLLGITPDMAGGHSYGELPALCLAGVFAPDQLVPLSEQRAKAILDAIEDDKGTMMAVSCNENDLQQILSLEPGVYAVNHNSPQQWVLAGGTEPMERLMQQLRDRKTSFRQLEVACAFHSPLLSKSKALYQQVLNNVPFRAPAIPVWSNTTAERYPTTATAIKERLTDHLVQPVLFSAQVQQMYAAGARVFIEAGPGKVLSGLVKNILGKDELLLHTEDKDQHGITHLLHMLGRYIASGREVALQQLFAGRKAAILNLDNPLQHARSNTVWKVNGHMALPVTGKLPPHGAMPVTTPLQLTQPHWQTAAPVAAGTSEQVVQEYLSNIKALIQAQRDVMMGFLGNPQLPAVTPAVVVQPAAAQQLPSPQPAVAAVTTATPVVADLKQLLLHIVSDKTGYPADMLGMDMDMEADLSIDSIKRTEILGELKLRLGGDWNGSTEQLSQGKTLQALLQVLQSAAPVQAAVALVTAAEQTHIVSFSAAELKQILLNVVSDKTGYPADMLGMELDLEADLSIDSIKRMEIIGELKTKTGFSGSDQQSEQLSALKTLQALVNWLAETLTRSFEPVKEAQKIIEEGFTPATGNAVLSRLRLEKTAQPLSSANSHNLQGCSFAVAGDTATLNELQALLHPLGATAVQALPGQMPVHCDGFIQLDLFNTSSPLSIADSMAMLQQLNWQQLKWVLAASDLTAHARNENTAEVLSRIQGYQGFIKSLAKEYEHVCCSSIELQQPMPADQLAALLLGELQYATTSAAISYDNGHRFVLQPMPAALETHTASALQLTKESVVLVLGGAQGITAELMIRFAQDYPCHFILVGRSADPRELAATAGSHLHTKEQIKQWLITGGTVKRPAEIEQRTQEIHKNNQARKTITALEQTGATVSYYSLDARDETALAQLVQQLYSTYGRIDGVVHGAGLLEDKLFAQKTPESFERVFTTKVNPMRVLAAQLQPGLQFMVLFSSVASAYGNRGQTDYAAANSVLDASAALLRSKLNTHVIAINWGPWKGTGMVSPSLEREYERKGIALIPLAHGMEAFMQELRHGNDSQVIIMAG